MCGIAGVVRGDARALEGMLDRMAHRGPDGRGASNGGVARLGCVRLAIRGGEAGAQPLRTRRGLLVFNGEIYNAGELVKELRWHGIDVDGSSDTAVVGALTDVYGIRAVDRLNGMYALAYDDGETVWLARDPAGVKPLYWRGDRFASEIGPLLEDASIDPAAMARWLTFHWTAGDQTLFSGVRRVPPGGIVALPGGRVVRGDDPGLRFGAGPNPALDAARLRKVLERAVGDAVPEGRFGVCLSGGVDSTVVAALARGDAVAYHGRVAEEGCDESPFARAAAEHLGLPLVEVDVTAGACLDAWPKVLAALEEPAAGPGSLGQWLVARRAAADVRVLLSGCGGDELFGGYARAAALDRDVPPPGLEAYAPLFARVRDLAPADRAFALLDRRDPALFRRSFLEAHPPPLADFADRFAAGNLDPATAAARAERDIVLPALLHVEDRVTMAFGVEGRVPLLDRRLLRSAVRMPAHGRVDADGRLKALFRDAAAPHLPPAVRDRRDKMGFPLPVGDWLRGPWRAFAGDLLADRRTRERGMLDTEACAAAIDSAGRYDRGLFAALSLELWCRAFLDG